jgi:hypothetical protein
MGQHPEHPFLDLDYDNDHRASYIVRHTNELPPLLRVRAHQSGHRWDERYAQYIERAGFLELVRVVNMGLPHCDPALITAAVDR